MATLIIRVPRSFPRNGLGAWQGWGSNPPMSTVDGSGTITSTGTSATGGNPGRRGRPRSGGAQYGQQSSNGSNTNSNWQGWQGQATQSSTAPTATDVAAFNQAIANALSGATLTGNQVSAYQTQAASATDAQLQALTAQINQTVAAAQAAATSAAATTTTAAATTSTSWWDGTTTLFGTALNNSTLAIGGAVALGLVYFMFGKKR